MTFKDIIEATDTPEVILTAVCNEVTNKAVISLQPLLLPLMTMSLDDYENKEVDTEMLAEFIQAVYKKGKIQGRGFKKKEVVNSVI
jgi:hypothetical protein|nr:MAG TPA: hypothetical protein [Caudoviricetes sp.]